MPSLEVVVAGNVGIDTNVALPVDFIPAQLATVEAAFTDNEDGIGQAGGYSSLGYASLGRRVGFVGYVGDDPLGRWIEGALDRAGVELLLFTDPAGTSRSINLMRPDGTRNTFYDGKSHLELEPDLDRCVAFLAGARLVHVHLANWCRRLLAPARAAGLTIAVDLQDVPSPDDPYRRDFIEAADIIFASAVQADDARRLAEALANKNPQAEIVLGRGARGASLLTPGAGYREAPPARMEAPVVNTNGAGDSLAVGYLVARILSGFDADRSLQWGQTAARFACAHGGAGTPRLIREPELMAIVGQGA